MRRRLLLKLLNEQQNKWYNELKRRSLMECCGITNEEERKSNLQRCARLDKNLALLNEFKDIIKKESHK